MTENLNDNYGGMGMFSVAPDVDVKGKVGEF